jgi:hypothetical protein
MVRLSSEYEGSVWPAVTMGGRRRGGQIVVQADRYQVKRSEGQDAPFVQG